MSVHTKKRLTKERLIVITLKGPVSSKEELLEAASPLGFSLNEDSVEWESAFPESSPGTALSGARYREGITQRRLAELTGIPQRHISEMENGKRPIGKERAKRLGVVLNVGYKVFL